MAANAIRCPHERAWDQCIRCDPWRPQDATEEQLDEWQRLYDQKLSDSVRATMDALRAMRRHGDVDGNGQR